MNGQELRDATEDYINAMSKYTANPNRETLRARKLAESKVNRLMMLFECDRPYIGHFTTNRNGVMVFHARSD
jgi:hypothetical protein